MQQKFRNGAVLLCVAVLAAVSGCRAQTQEAECAVFESLYTAAVNTTLPWPKGQCCGYAVGKNFVLCTDAGRIQQIEISRGGLRGTLPSLAAMTELQLLYLPANYIQGAMPSLAALTQLKWLDLSENDLTGTIPSLAANTLLIQVDLYGNMFTGNIPDLSTLSNLVRIDVHNNNLTGSVDGLLPQSLTTCLLSFDNSNPGLSSCANNIPLACADSLPAVQPACPSKTSSATAGTSTNNAAATTAAAPPAQTSNSNSGGGNVKANTTAGTDPVALAGVIGGGIVALLAALMLVTAIVMLRKKNRESLRPSSPRSMSSQFRKKPDQKSNYDPIPTSHPMSSDSDFEMSHRGRQSQASSHAPLHQNAFSAPSKPPLPVTSPNQRSLPRPPSASSAGAYGPPMTQQRPATSHAIYGNGISQYQQPQTQSRPATSQAAYSTDREPVPRGREFAPMSPQGRDRRSVHGGSANDNQPPAFRAQSAMSGGGGMGDQPRPETRTSPINAPQYNQTRPGTSASQYSDPFNPRPASVAAPARPRSRSRGPDDRVPRPEEESPAPPPRRSRGPTSPRPDQDGGGSWGGRMA
ncbi:hypothetical protein HDU93_005416 [Gonapodya sp. JEL0774]|nr:hypothetical protein HDU93_005416 [Gonapodya sp. JEL0774]